MDGWMDGWGSSGGAGMDIGCENFRTFGITAIPRVEKMIPYLQLIERSCLDL